MIVKELFFKTGNYTAVKVKNIIQFQMMANHLKIRNIENRTSIQNWCALDIAAFAIFAARFFTT
jgi:hypothetical protein